MCNRGQPNADREQSRSEGGWLFHKHAVQVNIKVWVSASVGIIRIILRKKSIRLEVSGSWMVGEGKVEQA